MERSGGAALVASPQPSTASPCSPALTRETRLNPLVTRETRSLPHDQRRDMGDNILFTDRLFLASWYTPFLHTTGMICTLENEGRGFFIAADRQILRVSSSDLTTVAFTCSDSVLRMLHVPPSKLLVIMTADKHLVVIQIQEDGSLSLSSKIVCAKRPVSMDFYSFGDSKMALLYAGGITF